MNESMQTCAYPLCSKRYKVTKRRRRFCSNSCRVMEFYRVNPRVLIQTDKFRGILHEVMVEMEDTIANAVLERLKQMERYSRERSKGMRGECA